MKKILALLAGLLLALPIAADVTGLIAPPGGGSLAAQPPGTIVGNCSTTTGAPTACTQVPTGIANGGTINVQSNTYGALGNTRSFSDGTITGGALSTLTSATAGFTSAAVGYPILIRGAGAAGISFITTIASVTNSTTVTLTAAASTAVSGAVFFYGADDTTAVTNAIAAAVTAHACVFFPVGGYWLYSQTTPITLTNACLKGDAPTGVGADYTHNGGTLIVTNTTGSVFTFGRGNEIDNLAVYYPAQDGSASTPLTYPPLFVGTYIENDTFNNDNFINPYALMTVNTGSTGLGDVRMQNIRAYCVNTCFVFNNGSPDVLQIVNSFFSPGVYEDIATGGNKYLGTWSGANAAFIYVNSGSGSSTSVTGLQLSNDIVYGFRYGMEVVTGTVDISSWSNVLWDTVSTVLSITGSTSWVRLIWTGGTVTSLEYNGSGDSNDAISMTCSNELTDLNIVGVNFSQSNGHWYHETNFCSRNLVFSNNRFYAWGLNLASQNAYGIGNINNYSSAAHLIITGNVFNCTVSSSNSPDPVDVEGAYVLIADNNFWGSCAYPVITIGPSGLFTVTGNTSSGTFGAYSLNDSTTGTAVVYDIGNTWDKKSNLGHPTLQGSNTFHGITAPTVTSGGTACGTSPTVATGSADGAGSVTIGSSTNGGNCPIVFSQTHTNVPDCHGTNQTHTANTLTMPATVTGVTPTGTLTAADVITYTCTFYQ